MSFGSAGGAGTTVDHPRGRVSLYSPAPDGLSILPVAGIPDVRPGDDLAATLLDATAGLIADGDVLVVTSKIVSKAEGRLVTTPTDPDDRDAYRRELIDRESVRLVAQIGRTKIVENRLGIVTAAAGIDASNVHADEIALLPLDPDATAARLVHAFASAGHRVGVIITDTQGRAWREGVTDIAIGAAGVPVLDDHRGGIDDFGNELAVTQVAVGDEIAAAADLVKGKLSGLPVAVVRGINAPGLSDVANAEADPDRANPQPDPDLANREAKSDTATVDPTPIAATVTNPAPVPATVVDPAPENTERPPTEPNATHLRAGGRALIRDAQTDLFRLGTDLAIELGRRDALAETTDGHRRIADNARAVLTAWHPPNRCQGALREAFLALIAARPDATSRGCVPGHITASTIVLSADLSHTLLTLHPRVGRWVQLGGHCEDEDGTIVAAATREAREESGIADLTMDPVPIALDIHPITCSLGVATRHFDVRFVAVAPPGAIPIISDESRDLRFWPVDALPDGADEDGLTQAVKLAVARARRHR